MVHFDAYLFHTKPPLFKKCTSTIPIEISIGETTIKAICQDELCGPPVDWLQLKVYNTDLAILKRTSAGIAYRPLYVK